MTNPFLWLSFVFFSGLIVVDAVVFIVLLVELSILHEFVPIQLNCELNNKKLLVFHGSLCP